MFVEIRFFNVFVFVCVAHQLDTLATKTYYLWLVGGGGGGGYRELEKWCNKSSKSFIVINYTDMGAGCDTSVIKLGMSHDVLRQLKAVNSIQSLGGSLYIF